VSTPRVWAISDLHLGYAKNRAAISAITDHGDDWLIIGGDNGEDEAHLVYALRVLGRRFRQLVFVPGNHELWTVPGHDAELRGVAKYDRLVAICRAHGVLTPEDPWATLPGADRVLLAPLHLLYDYSFGPDDVTPEEAVAWAAEVRIRCRDEQLLHPDPYPTRGAWCAARVRDAETRMAALTSGQRLVVVNHFPLRRDLVRLKRLARFAIWCGTRATEDWHRRFPIDVVVLGHLHMRATDWRDGVRFEEVSLGYPRHWRPEIGAEGYLRQIWPGPRSPGPDPATVWHR